MSTFNHPVQGRSTRRRLTLFLMVVFLSSRMVFQKPSSSSAQPTTTALNNSNRQVQAKSADKSKSGEPEGHSITLLEGLAIGAAVLFVFSLFTDSGSGGDSSYSHDDEDVEGNLRTWKQREENYERERQTESRNNAEYMMEQKRQQDNLYYEQRKQEQGY